MGILRYGYHGITSGFAGLTRGTDDVLGLCCILIWTAGPFEQWIFVVIHIHEGEQFRL